MLRAHATGLVSRSVDNASPQAASRRRQRRRVNAMVDGSDDDSHDDDDGCECPVNVTELLADQSAVTRFEASFGCDIRKLAKRYLSYCSLMDLYRLYVVCGGKSSCA